MNTHEQDRRKFFNGGLLGLMLLGLALTVEPAMPAHAESLSAIAAINEAGRQRMLSQRIVKAYCLLGLNVLADKSQAILKNSASMLDTQLAELKQFSENKADINEALTKEEQLWLQVKAIIGAPVSMDGARKLVGLNEELLEAADRVTKLIENSANVHTGHLVNVAGRQRMLSQRIAKFYMLSKWGFKQPEIADGIALSEKAFVSALQELESSPQNTPQIIASLAEARLQWDHFLMALGNQQSNDTGSTMVAAFASEHLLDIMDKITNLYETQTASS